MNELEMYVPPQVEILHFAAFEAVCYDDSWVRSGEGGDGSDNGIELPDDIWGGGNGEIELPDDSNI